jgi:hypothetical protein
MRTKKASKTFAGLSALRSIAEPLISASMARKWEARKCIPKTVRRVRWGHRTRSPRISIFLTNVRRICPEYAATAANGLLSKMAGRRARHWHEIAKFIVTHKKPFESEERDDRILRPGVWRIKQPGSLFTQNPNGVLNFSDLASESLSSSRSRLSSSGCFFRCGCPVDRGNGAR